jgi:hypothetical protein
VTDNEKIILADTGAKILWVVVVAGVLYVALTVLQIALALRVGAVALVFTVLLCSCGAGVSEPPAANANANSCPVTNGNGIPAGDHCGE